MFASLSWGILDHVKRVDQWRTRKKYLIDYNPRHCKVISFIKKACLTGWLRLCWNCIKGEKRQTFTIVLGSQPSSNFFLLLFLYRNTHLQKNKQTNKQTNKTSMRVCRHVWRSVLVTGHFVPTVVSYPVGWVFSYPARSFRTQTYKVCFLCQEC